MNGNGNNAREYPVRIEDGTIVAGLSDRPIEHPALVIDETTGTLHKFGDAAHVHDAYDGMCRKLAATGLADGLVLIEMDDMAMTREEQAYVINRCVLYTASGFQTGLCRHVKQGDALEWIRAEMARLPL